MNILVWHWGRRGAGPLIAARLASAFAANGKDMVTLSLAAGAEILAASNPLHCDWPEPTYTSSFQYILQRMTEPLHRQRVLRRLQTLRVDKAICAMPALLDGRMMAALRSAGIPYSVVVHDAVAHPGDWFQFSMVRQRRLLRNASTLLALSSCVEASLWQQGFGRGGQKIVKLWHPPFHFRDMSPPFVHGEQPRLLFLGRLLPYKGLDLLADALTILGPDRPFNVRICGQGPASRDLNRLRAIPRVEVENRWFSEEEFSSLIEWADGCVLPYRQASQSGVAAAAIAQGRRVLATNVGGLPEQLVNVPGTILCEPTGAAIAQGLKQLFQDRQSVPSANPVANWKAFATAILDADRGALQNVFA